MVIGVDDDGNVLGIDRDLSFVQNSNDKFLQLLGSVLGNSIGAQFTPYIRIRFEALDGNQVCVIDVDKGPEPAFIATNKGKEFFIRVASTSHSLNNEDTYRYISTNWE